MFDFYLDLPAWIRASIAAVFMVIGIALAIIGFMDRPQVQLIQLKNGDVLEVQTGDSVGARPAFRYGIIFTGLGAVLLLACGKSRAEKSGYNF